MRRIAPGLEVSTETFERAELLLEIIGQNFQSSLDAHVFQQELIAFRNRLPAESGASPLPIESSTQFPAPCSNQSRREAQSRGHQVVEAMFRYLHHNFHRSMSLKEVASYLGMNANYLSGLFRKVTGVTFHRYLEITRITKAKELLGSPRADIEGVAHAVGYVSANHFRKVFKAYEGMCPCDWAAIHVTW